MKWIKNAINDIAEEIVVAVITLCEQIADAHNADNRRHR